MSAIAGSLGVVLPYLILRELRVGRALAALACLSLGLADAYWRSATDMVEPMPAVPFMLAGVLTAIRTKLRELLRPNTAAGLFGYFSIRRLLSVSLGAAYAFIAPKEWSGASRLLSASGTALLGVLLVDLVTGGRSRVLAENEDLSRPKT